MEILRENIACRGRILSKYIAIRINFRCYVVDCVYDVEQTLYEYQGNEYDLIVLDLNLPIVDGLDALKQSRSKIAPQKILIYLHAPKLMILF